LSFIYLLIVICGSVTLGWLLYFISVHFWLNGVLYFSLKSLFCGKSFFRWISVHFLLTKSFSRKKIFYVVLVFFSISIHSLAYLWGFDITNIPKDIVLDRSTMLNKLVVYKILTRCVWEINRLERRADCPPISFYS
jgi:hypothetical protein